MLFGCPLILLFYLMPFSVTISQMRYLVHNYNKIFAVLCWALNAIKIYYMYKCIPRTSKGFREKYISSSAYVARLCIHISKLILNYTYIILY